MISILYHMLAIAAWLAAEGTARDPWDLWVIVHAAHTIGPQYGIAPEELLAVAGVESRWRRISCSSQDRACGVYQQIPRYSGMWHDECWHGSQLVCRQPGAEPYSPGELGGDVYLQTRVAARHLAHLRARYPGEYLGAYTRGARRRGDAVGVRYTERVTRTQRRLARRPWR